MKLVVQEENFRYRLWRIAAVIFKGVLYIRITQLQRSATLYISYILLQLLEIQKFWIVYLILTFIQQLIHISNPVREI